MFVNNLFTELALDYPRSFNSVPEQQQRIDYRPCRMDIADFAGPYATLSPTGSGATSDCTRQIINSSTTTIFTTAAGESCTRTYDFDR